MAFLLGISLAVGLPAVALGADIGHVYPDCSSGPLASNDVCNTKLSPGERAKALISALTTEEKFTLLGNSSPGVERLGLPSYEWWQEALHGVAESPGVTFNETGDFSHATSFPQPLLMGAAFDDDMIEAVATVVSTEARAFNNFNRSGLDYWTPNINPYRDPRWGRGQETPGEDPFHLGSYVKSLIKGLQGGDDPEVLKVVATCKHFAGYDMENWHGIERYEFDAEITPQDLAEYYTPPFESCVRANVGSFMCTYNAVNGVPTCASNYLLKDLLRNHWGWDRDYQYVTSDCDAIQNIYLPHGYRPTRESAAAAGILAGTDLDCGAYYSTYLPDAFSQGLIAESDLDRPLIRLYSALAKLGYFNPADSVPYRSLTFANVSTPYALDLARIAAEKSIVLLKNQDSSLPLSVPSSSSEPLKVAFLGGWATATDDMQGNYAGVAPYLHSPYDAASNISGIDAISGGDPGDPTTNGYAEVLDAAEKADVILFFDGPNNDDESEENDRNNIRYSGERIDILSRLAATKDSEGNKKKFVLVTMGGQQDTSPFLSDPNVDAIIWAGYPGQSGGDAIMNVLTGVVAPAGRLPVTQYPADYVHQVDMTDMRMRPEDDFPGRTYMWYNGKASAEFGFGLHYTDFGVSVVVQEEEDGDNNNNNNNSWDTADLVKSCDGVDSTMKDTCEFTTVKIAVQNVLGEGEGEGKGVKSDFVVLGFISGKHGPQPYPNKRLVKYARLSGVKPGEKKVAELDLTLGSLARRDDKGNLVLFPGDYSLLVDVPTQATWNFTLTGEQVVLSEWPQDTGN